MPGHGAPGGRRPTLPKLDHYRLVPSFLQAILEGQIRNMNVPWRNRCPHDVFPPSMKDIVAHLLLRACAVMTAAWLWCGAPIAHADDSVFFELGPGNSL